MSKINFVKKPIIIVFGSIILLTGAWTLTRAMSDEITVCVNRIGGMYLTGQGVRVHGCLRNETEMSWNIQGPRGLQGEPGKDGKQGRDANNYTDPATRVDYQILSFADPCTLNTFGMEGWQIGEMGAITQRSALNKNCELATVNVANNVVLMKVADDNLKYEYTIMKNVDPCSLLSVADDGWRFVSGWGYNNFSGFNKNCDFASVYGASYALFEKVL